MAEMERDKDRDDKARFGIAQRAKKNEKSTKQSCETLKTVARVGDHR